MKIKFTKNLVLFSFLILFFTGCANNGKILKDFKHDTPLIKEDIKKSGKAEIAKTVEMGPTPIEGDVKKLQKRKKISSVKAKNYLLTVTSGKAMVNITPLIVDAINQGIDPDFIIRLLFDIKRCGDWEQSRSAQLASTKPSTANTMFCTGDVLCSFFSRLTEGNCIWHYEGGDGAMGWVLTLFRSPNGQGVSPKVKQTLEIIRQSKTVELVLDRICHQRELQQSFATVKQLAQDALNSGARYQLTIDERGTGPFTLAIEALATQLCQLGMADIISKADEYIDLLLSFLLMVEVLIKL